MCLLCPCVYTLLSIVVGLSGPWYGAQANAARFRVYHSVSGPANQFCCADMLVAAFFGLKWCTLQQLCCEHVLYDSVPCCLLIRCVLFLAVALAMHFSGPCARLSGIQCLSLWDSSCLGFQLWAIRNCGCVLLCIHTLVLHSKAFAY